jgi:hypothetical protein
MSEDYSISIRSTAAFNAICQFKPAEAELVRQIDIQIVDPFGDAKSIPLKVSTK